MKRVFVLLLSTLITTGVFAADPAPQSATGTKKAAHKKAAPRVSPEYTEVKQALDAQQQQIQQLRQDLQTRDQAIQQLQQRLDQSQAAATQAQSQAEAAAAAAGKQEEAVTALKGDISDIKQNSTNTALTLQETQKNISGLESPIGIHYKGITITPGGFLAAETVWRRAATGSDINTPFNSIPFPGSAANHLSEFFGSGRQSRISMLAEGKLGNAKLTGYVEADFLSAGVTSNGNESNSYTLRQRQTWAQAALSNGWTFTGGQMWSLVAETRNGVDNRSEALPTTIDPQYTVGFSWARQYGFRVSKNLGSKMALGFSVENAQTTTGGEGTTCPTTSGTGTINGASGTVSATTVCNFVIGAAGTSGGLYNPSATYAFNAMPDLVGKIVFQPAKTAHIEVFGLYSRFRDRIYPGVVSATSISAAGAYNDSSSGGGAGANVRVSTFNKHLDIGMHFLGGEGIGRYGTGGLADVFVRPDGVLVPIRSYQGLGTLEYHGKKLDIYAYVGEEYAGRQSLSATSAVGYGSPRRVSTGCYTETVPGVSTIAVNGATAGTFPTTSNGFVPGAIGNCNVDTRDLIEGTVGFWYRVYSGPKGRIQWGPQFSYVLKNTWAEEIAGGRGNPSASEPMVFTSFRYYLPDPKW